MRIFSRGEVETSCSFCGKSHDQVEKLVAGPDVFICDSCVAVCSDILAREMGLSKLIKLGDSYYNLDQLVSFAEVPAPPPIEGGWDAQPGKELLLQFAGGVSVRAPLSERDHIEKFLLRGIRTM